MQMVHPHRFPDLQLLGKTNKLKEGKECIETGEVQKAFFSFYACKDKTPIPESKPPGKAELKEDEADGR